MKQILISLSTVLILIASGKSEALPNEPLQPAAETPFTSESDPSLAGIISIAVPPIDLRGVNLSFDLTIENPNDKPIRCLNTKFRAWMSPVNTRCERSDYNKFIDASEGLGYILIPANSTSAVKHVGNKEREDRGRELGKDLELCRRDAWDLKCGYDCTNVRKFGDEWDETITGGTRKFKCELNGEAKRTPDVVVCNSGYKADLGNDRCLLMCDTEHVVGDSWTEVIDHGTIYYGCLASGQVLPRAECDQSPKSYTPEKGPKPEEKLKCVPSPCAGGVKHGERGNLIPISHGSMDSLCEYGGWVDTQVRCDADSVKEANSCRLGNSCGNHPHQSTWTVLGPCRACAQQRTTLKCNDGGESQLSSKEVFCSPPRGRVCD